MCYSDLDPTTNPTWDSWPPNRKSTLKINFFLLNLLSIQQSRPNDGKAAACNGGISDILGWGRAEWQLHSCLRICGTEKLRWPVHVKSQT